MKRLSMIVAAVLALWLLAGCAAKDASTPAPANTSGMANPASTNCIQKGGKLEIRTDASGGQIGVCVFPDKSECEEWAYFNEECKPGQGTVVPPDQTVIPASSAALLRWNGSGELCGTLAVSSQMQMTVSKCGGQPGTSPIPPGTMGYEFLKAMADRLGTLHTSTDVDTLDFSGKGRETSPAWQTALSNWARATFSQQTTGHICAACGTILSLQLEPNGEGAACQRVRLTIFDFGYASREALPCVPQTLQKQTGAVLETSEWQALSAMRLRLQRTDLSTTGDYFDGAGTQSLTQEDKNQLVEWAQALSARLAGR